MFQRSGESAKTSAGQGPFAGPGGTRDRQLFIALKPICVQILTHCRPGQTSSPKLASDLGELRSALAKVIQAPALPAPLATCSIEVNTSDPPLGASLLRYVFFPISQIFQAAPKGPSELPDSTRREAFACLSLLVEQWWRQWVDMSSATGRQESIQMWRQLLILAAVALTPAVPTGGNPTKRTDSPETSLAILRLLHSLLVPRVEVKTTRAPPTPNKQWEWDGESELPSLDELDAHFADVNVGEGSSKQSAPASKKTIYPTTQHQALCNDKSYLSPLVHALTACLDLTTESDSHSSLLELKSTALEVVRIIATHWIAPGGAKPAERAKKMATVLPGIVGKVVTLVTTSGDKGNATQLQSSGRVPGPLMARAVTLLTDVCQVVLNDQATAVMRRGGPSVQVNQHQVKTLEEVVAEANEGESSGAASTAEQDMSAGSIPSARKPTDPLRLTLNNITLAMQTLASDSKNTEGLGTHSHPLAQQSVVTLSKTLLQDCTSTMIWFEEASQATSVDAQQSFAHLSTLLLRWLLDLADDSSTALPKSTSDAARDALSRILQYDVQQGSNRLCLRLGKEASSCMEQISTDITSQKGPQVARLSRRVCAAMRCLTLILSTASPRTVELVAHFMDRSRIERWGSKLVSSMQVSSALASTHSESIASSADLSRSFSALGVNHLDAREARSLSAMLREYGVLCGSLTLAQVRAASSSGDKQKRTERTDAVSTVDYFLESSRRCRRLFKAQQKTDMALLQQSTAALYVSRELIVGIAQVLQDARLALEPGKVGRRARKIAHRFAESLVADVLEAWEEEAALVSSANKHETAVTTTTQGDDALTSQADGDASRGVSYSKGLPSLSTAQEMTARPERFGPALNLSFVDSAVISGDAGSSSGALSQHAVASMIADNASTQRSLQLSLLALSSVLLGPSFRSHLLPTLYPTISALAAPSSEPAQIASDALTLIAHSSGYADLLTCVRENVDYILGEASWRLVSGLGRELEWRVARGNSDTAPTALLSAVSPPMVLTQVMRLLGPESLHLIEDSIDEVLDALDRFHGYADICESLLVVLDRLLEVMREGQREDASGEGKTASQPSRRQDSEQLSDFDEWLVKRTQRASGEDDVESAFDKVESTAQEGPQEGEESSASTPAATRSQHLISTILSKSIPFLSHSNPLIRSRVLRILGAGTELLCPVSSGQRREDDLLPLINRCWPLVVARLGWDMNRPIGPRATPTSEDVSYVHIAAIDLCRTFAVHIPDFMGRRIAQDAWPRVRALITMRVREAENVKSSREAQTRRLRGVVEDNKQAVSTRMETHSATKTTLADPHSPLSQLVHSTTQALTPLIAHQGPSFPSTTLWEILSHPILSAKVDVDLLKASERCDGLGTVWALCSGSAAWPGLRICQLDPLVGRTVFG